MSVRIFREEWRRVLKSFNVLKSDVRIHLSYLTKGSDRTGIRTETT